MERQETNRDWRRRVAQERLHKQSVLEDGKGGGELIPGKDGEVRAAVVKVASSSKRPALLRIPLQHLIPIEVKVPASVQPEGTQADETRVTNDTVRPR